MAKRQWSPLLTPVPPIALLLTSGVLLLLVWTTSAQAITQNLSWVGPNGFSMTGTFSYTGTGIIDETNVTSLMIEGFQYGTSIGTWDLVADELGAGALPFNVNFDTTTNTFLVGGLSSSSTGQSWNSFGNPGIGFGSGTLQGLFALDGSIIDDSVLPIAQSTLTASLKPNGGPDPIPEPSTMLLMGSGLVGLMGWRWIRRKHT